MPQPPFDVELSAKQPDGSPGGNAFLSSEELRFLQEFLLQSSLRDPRFTDREAEMFRHILFVLDCFV